MINNNKCKILATDQKVPGLNPGGVTKNQPLTQFG